MMGVEKENNEKPSKFNLSLYHKLLNECQYNKS